MQLCGNLKILWHCLSLGLEWKRTFSSPLASAEFSKFAGILSFFIMMLPKAHMTSHSRRSDARWVITPPWLYGSLRYFVFSFSVYTGHLFLISYASVRPISFLSFIVPIFARNVPLVSLIFLKRALFALVFPHSFVFLYFFAWSLRKFFLSLLAILCNCTSKWVYFSFLLFLFLHLFSKLFVRPPQTTIFPFALLFIEDRPDHHFLYNVQTLYP